MAFETWQDPNERKSLQRERQARLESSPFGSFQFKDVTFSVANSDTEIPISLKVNPDQVEFIRFLPVSQGAAGSVYRNLTGSGAKAWSATRIYLRSSATGTIRMLIFTEA